MEWITYCSALNAVHDVPDYDFLMRLVCHPEQPQQWSPYPMGMPLAGRMPAWGKPHQFHPIGREAKAAQAAREKAEAAIREGLDAVEAAFAQPAASSMMGGGEVSKGTGIFMPAESLETSGEGSMHACHLWSGFARATACTKAVPISNIYVMPARLLNALRL